MKEEITLENIKELYKNKDYEQLKRICKKYAKFNRTNTIQIFKIAYVLAKDVETVDTAKYLLKCLINSNNKKYATQLLTSIYMLEGKFDCAENLLKYSLENGTDSFALLMLSRIEKSNGNYKNAKEYLSLGLTMEDYDDLSYMYELILLEAKNKNYEEAYRLLTENECMKYHKKYQFILQFLKSRLELDLDQMENKYYQKQFNKYDAELAKKYLRQHRVINISKLYKNVNLSKLFEFSQEKIKYMKPVYSDYLDRYIIELEYEVGEIDDISTNYILVSTFLNSKEILHISPIKSFLENENVCRLEDDSNQKQLEYIKESQIEKFNKKYNFEN
jgi:hypothetical protein